jgi:formylglycine-generating enzyme required for sulfatase activity
MGSDATDSEASTDEHPAHRLHLPEFQIARTPVSNAQYLLYIQATGAAPPAAWEDGQPPKDKLGHPVVTVSWYDACQYCSWLSQVTGKTILLPSEAEWEKAARGDQDKRAYPWGETFDVLKCNNRELGLEDTTPVGIFPAGASPYGCLDMSGNVWEWTRNLWGEDWSVPTFKYPYKKDEREDVNAPFNVLRVRRGGAFYDPHRGVRCASRYGLSPVSRRIHIGFRVVVLPSLL